jgi:hypothetical protein
VGNLVDDFLDDYCSLRSAKSPHCSVRSNVGLQSSTSALKIDQCVAAVNSNTKILNVIVDHLERELKEANTSERITTTIEVNKTRLNIITMINSTGGSIRQGLYGQVSVLQAGYEH